MGILCLGCDDIEVEGTMTTTPDVRVTAAEIRKRVRAGQALQTKTRELAATEALAAREAAVEATRVAEAAAVAAREAVAAALRLFENDAQLLSELLEVPAEDLEREARIISAARAKEVIDGLRAKAGRPRLTRRTAAADPSSKEPAAETPADGWSAGPDVA